MHARLFASEQQLRELGERSRRLTGANEELSAAVEDATLAAERVRGLKGVAEWMGGVWGRVEDATLAAERVRVCGGVCVT